MIAETLFKFAIGYFALQTSSQITTITLAFAVPFLISTLIILPFTNTKSKKKPEQELKLNYKQIFLIFITFFMLNIPFTLDLILVNPAVRASYGALSLIGKIVYFGAVGLVLHINIFRFNGGVFFFAYFAFKLTHPVVHGVNGFR